ncbi:hypothetical protein D6D27_06260 [Aureobasidium pullulans]|nr:hypothetical protein D6D27_06260 [Aureobasidium pullulans]
MLSVSILSAVLLASRQALAASCSNFTITTGNIDDTYTKTSDRSYLISQGINCPSTQNCTIPIGGYITVGRTLNITTDSADSLFDTIASTVDIPWNKTTTQQVGTEYKSGYNVRNGTSVHVNFTPYLRCATGRLSGCDGGDLEDMVVEACTPYSIAGGLAGDIGPVFTDPEAAAALTCNPSNTTQAMNGNYTGSCDSTTGSGGDTGDASNFGGVSVLLLYGSLLVAVMGF